LIELFFRSVRYTTIQVPIPPACTARRDVGNSSGGAVELSRLDELQVPSTAWSAASEERIATIDQPCI
jgi:hypothetical protein